MSDDIFTRPPIAAQPISVVLISRGDPDSLNEVLSNWITVLDGLENEHETIVVRYESAGAESELSNVRSFHCDKGFGAALAMGIAEARHPLLCYCTADDQYEPADLPRLLAKIDETDIVTGFRLERKPPPWFRWLEWAYRGLLRVLFGIQHEPLPCWLGKEGFLRRRLAYWAFGLPLHDPECAFRLFRREILSRAPIQSEGAFAHLEIAAKANFLGALFEEEAVTYRLPQNPASAAGLEKPVRADLRRYFSKPDFGPVEVETWGYTCLSPKMLPAATKEKEEGASDSGVPNDSEFSNNFEKKKEPIETADKTIDAESKTTDSNNESV